VSRRYVDFEPELFAASEWRERDTNKKQGSKADAVECNDEIAQLVGDWNKGAIDLYKTLLEKKVAPELARTILPQNMYTEFIETASLSAYARLCKLRLDPQAQAEIREYATLVSKLLEEQFPVSWAALVD
jgi:thymidylate synthase (FAD)